MPQLTALVSCGSSSVLGLCLLPAAPPARAPLRLSGVSGLILEVWTILLLASPKLNRVRPSWFLDGVTSKENTDVNLWEV